jgi:hypothetical protein
MAKSKDIHVDLLEIDMTVGKHWLDPTEKHSAEHSAKLEAIRKRHRDRWLTEQKRKRETKARAWDEGKHPREPAGSSGGGEFTSGGGGGGGGGGGESLQVHAHEAVDKNVARRIQKAITGIPKEDAATIADVPIHVVKTTDDFPKISGKFRGGQSAGFFLWNTRTGERMIYMSTHVPGISKQVAIKDPEVTIIHELGHAIDNASGEELSKEYFPLMQAGYTAMTVKERGRASTRYYINSPKESFADLYALAHAQRGAYTGRPFCGFSRARAMKLFAEPLKKLKAR